MITERIYQKEVYRRTLTATVLSSNCDGQSTEITTDKTIFFPTGGGQSCDTGTIRHGDFTYSVYDVSDSEDDQSVIHRVAGNAADVLAPGADVALEIDWDRRFDNMQRHLGEHILSGAVYRLFGGTNKGFHMGEDHITIDIAWGLPLPADAADASSGERPAPSWPPMDAPAVSNRPDRMTWVMAQEAEREANRVITADLPVRTDYFQTAEEAAAYPLRKALAIDEDISVVTVGDPAHAMDCCPCCGTHPSSTGQVGLLKIYKIEPNKGMSRIYFDCGARALKHYEEQFNILYDLSVRLSSGYDELLAKYDAQVAHEEELRRELASFRRQVIDHETERILAELKPGYVYRSSDLSVDDLFNLSKNLKDRLTGLAALVCEPAHTAILLSDGAEGRAAGAAVKAHAGAFGGKGGGSPVSARAMFPDGKSLDAFLSAVMDQSGHPGQ